MMFAELLGHPGVRETCQLQGPVGVMAFHGGSLEQTTDIIADHVAAASGASLYAVVQPPDLRWHIPSKLVDPAQSPALADFVDHVDTAIAVHGYGRNGLFTTLLVGGRNRELAAHVRTVLAGHLDGYDVVDDLDAIPVELRGLHPDNPVNRLRADGVQLELPPRVRGLGPFWAEHDGPGLTPAHRGPHRRAGRGRPHGVTPGPGARGRPTGERRRPVDADRPPRKLRPWTCASSSSPSRAPATSSSWPSPTPPRRAASTASSARTTTCGWATVSALPGPTDAWVTLGAIARETSRIRLGTLVTLGHVPPARSARHRRGPGRPDERRPGRARHRRRLVRRRAHRLRHPVPDPRRALRPARGAAADHHRAVAHAARLPVLVRGRPLHAWSAHRRCPSPSSPAARRSSSAGGGPKRTPRLAAAYAAEFNLPFTPIDGYRQQVQRVREACEAIDRDPDDLVYSAALVVCCGENEEEVGLRAGRIGRAATSSASNGAAGSPAEVIDTHRRPTPRPAPAGSTSRSSTSTTSTTSTCSPRRSTASCPDPTASTVCRGVGVFPPSWSGRVGRRQDRAASRKVSTTRSRSASVRLVKNGQAQQPGADVVGHRARRRSGRDPLTARRAVQGHVVEGGVDAVARAWPPAPGSRVRRSGSST